MAGRPLSAEQGRTLVEAVRDVFRARGWEGASIADLAAATGLSRATLYHHFPNGKADMAAAALADVEERLENEILEPLRQRGTPPRARIEAMCAVLDAYYRGGELCCLLGAFTWNADGHGLGTRVAAAFTAWIDALDLVARDGCLPRPRERALAAVSAVQGGLVLATALQDHGPFRLALGSVRELFGTPEPD